MSEAKEVNVLHGVKRSEIVNLDKNQAFKFMMIEKDLEHDVANKVWALFGTKNKGGVFGVFLKFCEEKPQTAYDLAEFVMSDKSSPNEVRWFNQRDSIRKLAVAVFVKLGQEFTEKAVTEAQVKKMEAIVKKVAEVNKAKKAAKAK
jgi:hypothetical protein